MKIEKINDNQIRFIFMPQDLADRNININDFVAHPPNGSHGLFQEITSILQSDYSFAPIGTPLMFEATMSNDSLCVTVTRMNPDAMGGFQNMLGGMMSQINPQMHTGQNGFVQTHIPNAPQSQINPKKKTTSPKSLPPREYILYSFDNLDILATVASRIGSNFLGGSHVYKMEGKYNLLLQITGMGDIMVKKLEGLLCEFGKRELSGPIARNKMLEHGEVIIAEDAVRKLKLYGQF